MNASSVRRHSWWDGRQPGVPSSLARRAPAATGRLARPRSSCATVEKSLPPRPVGRRRSDHREVDGRLGDLEPERLGEGRDQPQVLGGEVERERDGRPVRVEERRALVAHVRRRDRARRQHVVGGRAVDARPARRATRPSASAPLSPKITVFTASFIAAPVPSGPRWKIAFASGSRAGRARSRSAASPPTMSVSWPDSAGRRRPADRGVEQPDAGGARRRRRTRGGRRGSRWTGRPGPCPARAPASSPSAPP